MNITLNLFADVREPVNKILSAYLCGLVPKMELRETKKKFFLTKPEG